MSVMAGNWKRSKWSSILHNCKVSVFLYQLCVTYVSRPAFLQFLNINQTTGKQISSVAVLFHLNMNLLDVGRAWLGISAGTF